MTLAGFGPRAAGWLLDAVPHALVPYLLGRIVGSVAVGVAGFVAVGVLWSVIPEARFGRTLGKLVVGLRTIDARGGGAPIGLGRSAVRWLVKYPVCGALPVGYLFALRDARRQALHDLAAGTQVAISRR